LYRNPRFEGSRVLRFQVLWFSGSQFSVGSLFALQVAFGTTENREPRT